MLKQEEEKHRRAAEEELSNTEKNLKIKLALEASL
jgi:hypothetical protein